MDRLTPELWLHTSLKGLSSSAVTQELDFNLARRSAVVINHIASQLYMWPDVTSGHEIAGYMAQEIDVDPDNTILEFAGALPPAAAVVVDSSRVFRHIIGFGYDTAAGVVTPYSTLMQRDWTSVPFNERPISITNMRHHLEGSGGISNTFYGEIHVAYFIVELSLAELGLLNASRR